ncbi:hypothetical protein FBF75_17045 [Bacillus sp. S2(2019)]|uniref:Uncharacterized protein n=1 Tax=Bacillus sp. BS1807G30 TaxID=3153756 RepID=A0AAU7FMQ5_9BACI|nr:MULTISPECIES: hypothetical protein [Bacillus]CVN66372.1 Uncharacterised protein [Streptococcus pneumoniae]MDI6648533.1 hypothetical protein [Bacillus altitudinis]MDI6663156.1 hypothetical protein [Bacillus altitudinis]TKD55533.1 hypothetical protein FBF75_17045 [Bacillus sp. S2(2019)]WOI42034.1 hypothetical protein RZ534_03670 [Bacillus altitudinis]
MTFRKKFVPILLSATLLTSGLGATTAFAAEPAKLTAPVHTKVYKTSLQQAATNNTTSSPIQSNTLATQTAANGEVSTQGVVSWSYKAFRGALRSGGWLLSKALKPFNPKAAAWIRKNSAKIAKIMDKGEKWTEKQFTKAFTKIGAPRDVAKTLAKFIINLI